MCVCVSVRPEADSKSPLFLSTLVFETGFLNEPLIQLGWLAKGYQRPSSLVLKLWDHRPDAAPGFPHGTRGRNSSPQACATGLSD